MKGIVALLRLLLSLNALNVNAGGKADTMLHCAVKANAVNVGEK